MNLIASNLEGQLLRLSDFMIHTTLNSKTAVPIFNSSSIAFWSPTMMITLLSSISDIAFGNKASSVEDNMEIDEEYSSS